MPYLRVQDLKDRGSENLTFRLLATIYKDERVRERQEVRKDGVSAILEKMYLGSLVKEVEVCFEGLIIGSRIQGASFASSTCPFGGWLQCSRQGRNRTQP